MKVLILKGDAPRHNYFAKEISLIEGVEATIVSFQRLGKDRLTRMIKKDFFTFFSRITKYTVQKILRYEKKELESFGKIQLLENKFENINSAECVSFIKSVSPDVIAIFGTPIISRKIIDIPKFGAINLHGGISPYYKGGNTIFWALYNKDLDKVGATIHYALPKVDSGQMLARVYAEIGPEDNEQIISIRTFKLATKEFCSIIRRIGEEKKILLGKNQEEGGKLYLAKHRTLGKDLFGHVKIKQNIKGRSIAARVERYYI